ncbi:hypothetical protein SRABI106_03449 [Rahnella aquatilis]|nr:hypothetical protein SRABI106_03449 [Rahnella aquatilis]
MTVPADPRQSVGCAVVRPPVRTQAEIIMLRASRRRHAFVGHAQLRLIQRGIRRGQQVLIRLRRLRCRMVIMQLLADNSHLRRIQKCRFRSQCSGRTRHQRQQQHQAGRHSFSITAQH